MINIRILFYLHQSKQTKIQMDLFLQQFSHQEDKAVQSLLQFQETSQEFDNWEKVFNKNNKQRTSKGHNFIQVNKKYCQNTANFSENHNQKTVSPRSTLRQAYINKFKRANSLFDQLGGFKKTCMINEVQTPKPYVKNHLRIFDDSQKTQIMLQEEQKRKKWLLNNAKRQTSRNSSRSRSRHRALQKSVELEAKEKQYATGESVMLNVQSYQQTLNKRQKQYWMNLNTQTNKFYPKISQKKDGSHFFELQNKNIINRKQIVSSFYKSNLRGQKLNQNRTNSSFDFTERQNDNNNNKVVSKVSHASVNPTSPSDKMSISIRYLLNSLNGKNKESGHEKHDFIKTQRMFNQHPNKPIQFNRDKLMKLYQQKRIGSTKKNSVMLTKAEILQRQALNKSLNKLHLNLNNNNKGESKFQNQGKQFMVFEQQVCTRGHGHGHEHGHTKTSNKYIKDTKQTGKFGQNNGNNSKHKNNHTHKNIDTHKHKNKNKSIEAVDVDAKDDATYNAIDDGKDYNSNFRVIKLLSN